VYRLLLAGLMVFLSAPQPQPLRPVNMPFTFVDFVPADAYRVLDRPNRIEALCGPAGANPQCVRKVMRPQTYTIRLHTAPAWDAPSAGTIIITAAPAEEESFTVGYIPPKGSPPSVPMKPDDDVSDWGYGSPFLYTVLERQQGWVKLPRRPFPEPVWFDTEQEMQHVQFVSVHKGDRYMLGKRQLVILAVLKNGLRVRDEQEADLCGAEGMPLSPFRPRDLTLDQLYDADGHFLMNETSPRGC
jgi:hypothetical protein